MALFPEMSYMESLRGFDTSAVISTNTFQTSWNCICLVPSPALTLDDEPQPCPSGTAQTKMPVIHVAVAQYSALITGLKRLDSQTGLLKQWFIQLLCEIIVSNLLVPLTIGDATPLTGAAAQLTLERMIA